MERHSSRARSRSAGATTGEIVAAPEIATRSTMSRSSSRVGYETRILSMKRSSWASGSGYVPSCSIGFWVASTRNGSSSRYVCSPIVTWRSCIASSSALCTLGGVRLISSARIRFANRGPLLVTNSPVFWL